MCLIIAPTWSVPTFWLVRVCMGELFLAWLELVWYVNVCISSASSNWSLIMFDEYQEFTFGVIGVLWSGLLIKEIFIKFSTTHLNTTVQFQTLFYYCTIVSYEISIWHSRTSQPFIRRKFNCISTWLWCMTLIILNLKPTTICDF